ncbi:unannotated protein [freshwater metagenome]|uniref:Unannotated protein n=1 Tax=freshwater metagenome TaxID=449393 RepID=A0A6J6EHD6_9ZZZZ
MTGLPPLFAGAAHVRVTPPAASTVEPNDVGAEAVLNGRAVVTAPTLFALDVSAVTRK